VWNATCLGCSIDRVYCFLWQMALVTFLGVIFIQAGSQMLNGAVILLTITSFASSMLVLADLEQPYTGAHDLAPPTPSLSI
jgi:hypothetical protein